MIQTVPIKDARNNLANLINMAAIAGHSYIITKFGKPQAMITPVFPTESTLESRRLAIASTASAWKHRSDIKDTAKFVAALRRKMSSRIPIAK